MRRAGSTTVRMAASPLGSPHRAVAVGDLPLDYGRAQQPLGAVLGQLDRAGLGEEDEELIASAADLGLEGSGQVAAARCAEDVAELSIQAPTLGGQRRGGQVGDALGQGEHGLQPELQPPGHGVVAHFDAIGDVPGEMGEQVWCAAA